MGSVNMLDRLQQFRSDVVRVMPFRQAARGEMESEAMDDELTEEEEEQFAQMVSFLGRLFPFVRPSPEFRARLKEALLAEHRRRLANEEMLPARQEGGISWWWSLAATVPLLIGVLATILWRRSHRSNGQLISPVGGR
ncbi:MAG: hypothetical protein F4Z82_12415 [Caldilineaceae bacterium SB0668_bin_21]|nr:hypothetical protein [Caldilineaceae bacterium SB0668_bin_21]MYC22745.1 hypothetical protein [Caldilineaceae bacterium SB0662_bin_25]